ncbi:MAG: S-methyl-5'-thioadenosine phosphorylase [Alphaproteobacteria bacterium]|nr:S-methyl-5'-thioadenosine phosphorylase [Alphaproteobacteria bacterium]
MTQWKLGIIGGSGLYSLDGLENVRTEAVQTPWGAPSAELTFGRLNGVELVFLPRHGLGHTKSPSDVPYRANIAALKMAGCTDILAVSACGSLKEAFAPGHFVIIDQYVDRTRERARSFFEEGCIAHVPMADPVCSRLSQLVYDAAGQAGVEATKGGTYLVMEGPQFSTRAESELYRSWGLDVIGMTNMPEARLAREAELPYAAIAMVTDYDCWHESEESVDVAAVLAVMKSNTQKAKQLLAHLTTQLGNSERSPSPDGIETCLDTAIVTPPPARDPAVVDKLRSIAGRALG